MSTFLGLTHNPFAPPREGFFTGGDRKTHLDHLRHLSQWSRRVLVVTGPFGIGKSSLFRELSSNLEANTKAARLSGTVITSEREVLAGLLQGFGISAASNSHVEDLADQVLAHVAEQEEQKRVCMAMVDDAHLMDMRAIHRLVELVAVSSLRLLLFCEAGLVAELDRVARMHDLEWFEIRLTGLPKADVRDYLEWRFRQAHYRGLLPFTDEQLDNIVVRSGGNLSVIDSMANRLLGELESGEIRAQKSGFPTMHLVLALSLVLMVGLVYTLVQQSSQPVELTSQFTQPMPQPQVKADPPPDLTPEIQPEVQLNPAAEVSPPAQEPIWADQVPGQAEAPAPQQQADDMPASADVQAAPLQAAEPEPELEPKPQPQPQAPQTADAPAQPPPARVSQTQPVAAASEAPLVEEPETEEIAAPQKYKGAAWLLRQNPQRFTLQLMTLSSRQRAMEFIGRQENQDEFAVYSMIRDGQRLYVVTYGVFSGRAAAQATAADFRGELAALNPWVRPMELVQNTVRDNPQS